MATSRSGQRLKRKTDQSKHDVHTLPNFNPPATEIHITTRNGVFASCRFSSTRGIIPLRSDPPWPLTLGPGSGLECPAPALEQATRAAHSSHTYVLTLTAILDLSGINTFYSRLSDWLTDLAVTLFTPSR